MVLIHHLSNYFLHSHLIHLSIIEFIFSITFMKIWKSEGHAATM